MLEGSRADDQNSLHADGAGENFHRGQRLDGLAEPHVIRHQRPAGASNEQRTLPLIRIKRHFEQRH